MVAEVPSLLREAVAAEGTPEIPIPAVETGAHGHALLVQIAQCLKERSAGLFDLTHFPLTLDDHTLIDRTPRRGRVRGWSRGYLPCQAETTGVRGLWRVRYRNGYKRAFDTIEIVDVPAVLRAPREDIDTSLTRFDELLRDDG